MGEDPGLKADGVTDCYCMLYCVGYCCFVEGVGMVETCLLDMVSGV